MKRLISIAILMIFALARSAFGATLQDLDRVLDQAGSFEGLLASPQLVEKYYRLSVEYYGGPNYFPRTSFDAILNDFKTLVERHPEFAEIAFRPRETRPPLKFESVIRGHGVSFVDVAAFRKIVGIGMVKSDPAALILNLKALRKALDQIRNDLKPELSKKQRRIDEARALQALKESPVFAKTRNLILASLDTTWLASNDADIALAGLASLRLGENHLIEGYEEESRLLLRSLPIPERLAEDRTLFSTDPATLESAEIEFVDVGRPFHSLFRGLKHKECVAGSCDNLKWLTRSRYGIPLLDGGHEIHVRRNGQFTGYVSETDVVSNGKRYFSLEVVTPFLKKQVWQLAEDGSLKRVSIFDLWLKSEMGRISHTIEGFVVGDGGSIHNGGGLPAIRTSGSFWYSERLGQAQDFAPADRNALALLDVPKPSGLSSTYQNNRLIWELGTEDVKDVYLLRPKAADVARLLTLETLTALLKGSYEGERKLWLAVSSLEIADPKIREILYEEANLIIIANNQTQHPLHRQAVEFIRDSSNEVIASLFNHMFPDIHSIESLSLAFDWVDATRTEMRTYKLSLLRKFLERPEARSLRESWKSWWPQLVLKVDTVEGILRLSEFLLPAVHSAEDYKMLTAYTNLNPSESYIEQTQKFHARHIETFANFHPNAQQWIAVLQQSATVDDAIFVLGSVIRSSRSAADVLSALTYAPQFTVEFERARDRFILENWSTLVRLPWSPFEREMLLALAYDSSASAEFARRANDLTVTGRAAPPMTCLQLFQTAL